MKSTTKTQVTRQEERAGILSADDIGYRTEPCEIYTDALRSARDKAELVATIKRFRYVATDALQAAKREIKTDTDFEAWRKFATYWSYRSNCPAAMAQRFGAILMPEVLLRVAIVASRFHAPWGCAFIRLMEEGMITECNGCAKWVSTPHKGTRLP